MTICSTASAAPVRRTSAAQWLAVAVLTLCTFTVVTSEMLPVGVLTPMAAGLGISPGASGVSLTITGLVSAVAAPVAPRLLDDVDRRVVLAAAMIVLAAGNALTTSADGFGMLLVSRIVLGIGMGTVWGLASAVAIRLVEPRNTALAVSIALSGVAAASVLGVPLGTFIANGIGWRAAFGTLSATALVLAVGLLFVLPPLRRPAGPSVETTASSRPRSLIRPAVVVGVFVVVLLVTAHFAAYTYVRPMLELRAQLSANVIALLLLLYGVFGLLGNFAAGALAGRRPRATVLLLATGITIALITLALLGTRTPAAVFGIAVWGISYGGLSVAGQLWMTSVAPDRVEHVTGLYVGVFTAAIALGAFAGGVVIERVGIVPLLYVSAVPAAAAVAIAAGRPRALREM